MRPLVISNSPMGRKAQLPNLLTLPPFMHIMHSHDARPSPIPHECQWYPRKWYVRDFLSIADALPDSDIFCICKLHYERYLLYHGIHGLQARRRLRSVRSNLHQNPIFLCWWLCSNSQPSAHNMLLSKRISNFVLTMSATLMVKTVRTAPSSKCLSLLSVCV